MTMVATTSAAKTKERQDGKPVHPRKALVTEVLTTVEEMQDIAVEWAALHTSSGTTNPFTHPSWMIRIAERAARNESLVLTVRERGRLVGVAPFSRVRVRGVMNALQPMGNRRYAQFTEMPGALTDVGNHRAIMRSVVEELQNIGGWDWVKLTLDGQQGWFEPQWLDKRRRRSSAFFLHRESRAFVVVDLPGSWDEFVETRKRNVRESMRRSWNRLNGSGPWSIEVTTDGPELSERIDQVIDLHQARAQMPGKPSHLTLFTDPRSHEFYVDAVTALSDAGNAEVSILRVDDRPVAGLVALRAGSSVFVSATGADPSAWNFSPGTVLIAGLAKREIERGTQTINLSSGPNQSKLRWNDRLECSHDFVIVGPRARSRLSYRAYRVMGEAAAARRSMRTDTRDT